MNRGWVRNVAVVIGASYLGWTLALPVVLGFARLTRGHIYSGDSGALLLDVVESIPHGVVGVIAGVVAGYTLQTLNPYPWALFAALWMGLPRIWAHRWVHPPDWTGVVGVVLDVLAIGGAVAFSLLYFYRRALPQPAADPGPQ